MGGELRAGVEFTEDCDECGLPHTVHLVRRAWAHKPGDCTARYRVWVVAPDFHPVPGTTTLRVEDDLSAALGLAKPSEESPS